MGIDIHSFPTRRSSDLGDGLAIGREAGVGLNPQVAGEPVDVPAIDLGVESNPCRSEEHTSELQSRFDIVCRLLLEKKKWIRLTTIIMLLFAYVLLGR